MKTKEANLDTGDVVILDFPGIKRTKRRPAVVLSTRLYHLERPDVIVGLITSQVSTAYTSTGYLLQDWVDARLRQPSAFRSFLHTLPRSSIKRRIGKLSNRDWRSVLERVQRALGWRQGH